VDQLVQFPDLCLQQVNLLLLAKDGPVEFFQMVFAEADLNFEFGDSGFHVGS
jgi:hypothetical protein